MAKRSPVKVLREEFRRLMQNAMYDHPYKVWIAEVRKLLKGKGKPTAQEWVDAAQVATVKCDRCNGSGRYQWGACVNGKMTHSGPCFRCLSKGRQGQTDFLRNRTYDNHMRVI